MQPDVARFAQVCSYDRAGLGWSDLGPHPRTLRQIVWELRALLDKARVPAPYLFVGLRPIGDADIRFVQGDVTPVHREMSRAVGDRDIWIVGGGDRLTSPPLQLLSVRQVGTGFAELHYRVPLEAYAASR